MSQENEKFLIFGNPIEHSKSPQMHNSAFDHLNLNSFYDKYLLTDGKKIKEIFNSENIKGANITVPHKEDAFRLADEVVGIANEIEAVNTYVKKDDKIYAYNTDAPGFLKAISDFGKIKSVLILGAGGTAKAIAMALKEENIEVRILNRSAEKLAFFKAQGFKTYTWGNFQMNHYDLIVNSTSAGLNNEDYPIKKTTLESIFLNAKYAFDCIYGKDTPFLKLAQAEGLKAKDGEDMLLYQGVLAFELFTDTLLDKETIEVMRKALKKDPVEDTIDNEEQK
ncbi:MAG: shikimate dehydrogenase [Arcobacter sp.]|uniref:shikimate dehydrogenase n=1 Tax=Arcobacter sp. TaxID=1872629 RepID=UPI003AFF7BC3